MEKEQLLSNLQKAFQPGVPHLLNEKIELEDWEKRGCPYMWETVWENEDALVLVDKGYGYVALFEDGMLAGVSGQSVVRGYKYLVVSDAIETTVCRIVKSIEA